jgi:ATP-binding cassette subfamily F protein uup
LLKEGVILLNTHLLTKSYSGRTLFRDVSFGVNEGDRIGLVGPNGAGKSTLLKALFGTVDADGGTISRKRGLRLGFMEQTPSFEPDATILSAVLEKAVDPNESLAQAMTVMAQLNLNTFDENKLVSELSGGWRKKVALAREVVSEPELLLLDEPTNHLDVTSILWLEEYLKSAPFAVMMVTHDRLFLQRVATRILDLDPRNPNSLLSVDGDYTTYMAAKEHELSALERQERVQRNQLRREMEWLSRGSLARQTKQSARIEAAAELKESVYALEKQNRPRALDLEFGDAESGPKKLVELEGVSKSYDGRILFENLDLIIGRRSRLALLGDNGTGKSTLIKLILGLEQPDNGKIKRADKLQYSHFEQGRDTIDPTLSVLQNICPEGDYVICQGSALHVRSYLDRFLFPGIKAELPAAKLSGGEQARLRLAQLMLNSSQILVLDEPTNDLDTDTLEVLETALKEYNGAVILVTHDRYFMDAVADEILAFPPTPESPKRLERFASYFQWESWREEQIATLRQKAKARAREEAPAPAKQKMSYKEKFELENMESTIMKIEKRIEELSSQSVLPEVLSDHKKLSEIHTALAEAQAELDGKFQRWAVLEAKK